jgi:glucose/arabinose dehydrogenase
VTIGRRDSHDGSSPLNRGPDSHAGDWYWINVGGNGQDGKENLLGSVLKIDMNSREQQKPYSIPEENQVLSTEGFDERYAWGFRNPYSMSFDGEDLYVTDAGTRVFEEVDLVKKDGNYGWNIKEGPGCHNSSPYKNVICSWY